MPLEPDADLHWTAFLYMEGELSSEQASAFEDRLAGDEAAREALTLAVELAEALAVVGPEFRRDRSRRRVARRVVVAVSTLAAAACLVVAVGWRFLPSFAERPDASEVAIAWSSLRADAEWLAVPPESTATATVAATAVEADLDLETEPATDRALPSWLLTAASATVDDEPGQED
jgi:hypothetical protein